MWSVECKKSVILEGCNPDGIRAIVCVIRFYAGRARGAFANRSNWPDLGRGNSRGRTISG